MAILRFPFILGLILGSISSWAETSAKECSLKAFNIYNDENFKTPEEDLIRKVDIFDAMTLSDNSSYMGVLFELKDLKDLSTSDLKAEIKLFSKRPSTRTHKVSTWKENKSYLVIHNFNPNTLLKQRPRAQKFLIRLKNGTKVHCEKEILIETHHDT